MTSSITNTVRTFKIDARADASHALESRSTFSVEGVTVAGDSDAHLHAVLGYDAVPAHADSTSHEFDIHIHILVLNGSELLVLLLAGECNRRFSDLWVRAKSKELLYRLRRA